MLHFVCNSSKDEPKKEEENVSKWRSTFSLRRHANLRRIFFQVYFFVDGHPKNAVVNRTAIVAPDRPSRSELIGGNRGPDSATHLPNGAKCLATVSMMTRRDGVGFSSSFFYLFFFLASTTSLVVSIIRDSSSS